MSAAHGRRYCSYCERYVLTETYVNLAVHAVHAGLTVLTCGLWGVVYLCYVLSGASHRCLRCGKIL